MKLSEPVRENPLILLVDDDEVMRLLAAGALTEMGFVVEVAEDGTAGIEAFHRLQPDIVLLDVRMPGRDGYAVCSELRSTAEGELVPILMMTSLDDTASINRAYQSGATDFATKPFNWTLLGHHLRYILRSSETAKALRRSQNELQESQERYALAARGANDGLWDWNIETGRVYYSSRWKSMLGLAEDEIGEHIDEWLVRIHPDDLAQVKMRINTHLNNASAHFEGEFRMRHSDGTYRWMLCRGIAVRDGGEKAHRMAGSMSDITMRKRIEQQLLHNAFYDALTGLPNRALLMDRLEHTWMRVERNRDNLFAVMFLDLDRFKVINDSLGHNVGDKLLTSVAKRLRDCVRPSDTVARLGGDEFVILLEDANEADDVRHAAERIQETLKNPFVIDNTEIFMSCSIGITLSSTDDYLRAEDLLRDADTAMYKAKSKGKARYEFFEQSMHARAVTMLHLESELRRALEREEFCLHYQPIVSLHSRRITSVEALIRWVHPRRGLVMPGEFLPFAEEVGLIIPIGQWVIRQACRQIKAWNDSGVPPLSVAVNISPRELKQKGFVDIVSGILRETSLRPDLLDLEITESAIIENPGDIVKILLQLKALGLHLSIDDFGTGYSSLSYLSRFPVTSVKIDQSFVRGMRDNAQNVKIIKTVAALSSALGLESTAEGVETIDQLEKLKETGCSQIQGFFFSRPADFKDIEPLLGKPVMLSGIDDNDMYAADVRTPTQYS